MYFKILRHYFLSGAFFIVQFGRRGLKRTRLKTIKNNG